MADNRLDLSEAWHMDQQRNIRVFDDPIPQSAWSAEFDPHQPSLLTQTTNPHGPSFMTLVGMNRQPVPMGMYGMSPPLGLYQGNYVNNTVLEVKGKGKQREVDFEAAFAHAVSSLSPDASTEDTFADVVKTLDNTSLHSSDGKTEDGLEFQHIWDQLQNSDLPPPKEDMSKWESEFSQLMTAQRDELDHDYGSVMQQAWDNGFGNFSATGLDTSLQFDSEGIPILGEYTFEQNNKYLEPASSRSFLNDAKVLLDQNGSLSEAALLLEAAIQRNDVGEGGYEAWILLGETRNMDEREGLGVKALLEGVKRAEEAGAPGVGMLSLAISFTNESFDRASHTMLLRWLRARFPSLPIPQETVSAMSTHSAWEIHDRITDLFLTLARAQHAEGTVDSEVQIGLGVLYYTNGEFGKATDCFESALALRPKDYLLWNRLGSSLSNGSKPEEALGAYQQALQLRPTYTRAIYNVGVACLNIGAHKEAAEHFLSALTLQESTSEDTSEALWSTLRRVLSSMDRPDLVDIAKPDIKGSLDIFRREGFDF